MGYDKDLVEQGVRAMLAGLGENTEREGIVKTPDRVARAMHEMLGGLKEDPCEILKSADFDADGYDQMISLRGVDFFSLCEHHLLPFYGTVTVAYIPKQRVVGLSKLARLVDCFSRRLQIQERMTQQIAGALENNLSPVGWGVIVKAHHLCMGARGVKKPNAIMTTTAVGGLIKTDPKAREEFLASV